MRGLMLLATLLPAAAAAGRCEDLAHDAPELSGDALLSRFSQVLACDPAVAGATFPTFMRASGDTETLVALSTLAIDQEVYAPVWAIMEVVRDFNQRAQIAGGIGVTCGDHPNVLPFVQGAYFGLRGLVFTPWAQAIGACGDDDIMTWAAEVVSHPPETTYDDKYTAITEAFVKVRKVEALPILQSAAIAGATTGPFDALLASMDQSIGVSGFGASSAPEDEAALHAALFAVGQAVPADKAALVADRLYAHDAEAEAAALLPRVYPDAVQDDGTFLHGVAALEACDGELIVHGAEVVEPGTRWSITTDVADALQAFRPRLHCESTRPWPTQTTPGPVPDAHAVADWLDGVQAAAATDDVEVKQRKESTITLP